MSQGIIKCNIGSYSVTSDYGLNGTIYMLNGVKMLYLTGKPNQKLDDATTYVLHTINDSRFLPRQWIADEKVIDSKGRKATLFITGSGDISITTREEFAANDRSFNTLLTYV